VAALALLGAATLQAPAHSGAEPGGMFRGTAAAEGIRVGVAAVGAPVTNSVVDGASPIAQAALDSTSGSSALASVAYPGDVVVTTPGLLAGVSGGKLSGVPPYPLIATAGSTTAPEQRVDAPGAAMRAAATARRAEATARSGATAGAEGAAAPAWATSSTVEADDAGAVTSIAVSEVTGVTLGPLTLGRVTARSVVRRAPGADPLRQTSFEVTGVTVGTTAVALTPSGLVVAGTTTPVSASAVQPVLDGAGISVRPLAAETTTDGVVSAGLVVTRTQPLPTAISPVTVTWTFGRAAAAVSAAPLPAPAPLEAVPPAPAPAAAGPGGGSEPANGADGGGALDADATGRSAVEEIPPPATIPAGAVGGTGGTGIAGAAALTADGPAAGSGADAAAAGRTGTAAAPVPPASVAAVPVRKVGSRLFDLSTIYLLLVAAAAMAGAVIQLVRGAGVRLPWTSRPG
jgi:hypothetical protein